MKLLKTGFILQPLFLLLVLCACNDSEIGSSRDVSPEAVYFDYDVKGDAETEDITVMLQFRFGGVNGTTLVLGEPSQVQFDGQVLRADSSKMSGAYYEIRKPAAGFAGKHTIIFTDLNKKQYTEVFEFPIFSLRNEVPASVKRDELVFELEGLNSEDYIQVLLNDTSFYSKGIDRLDTVKNGRITITKTELLTLHNGPVNLEFYRDGEKALQEKTKEGGKLSMSYGIKRQFELTD